MNTTLFSPHDIDCFKQRFKLQHSHKSIIQKNKVVDSLIDEILNIEANLDSYDAEHLELRKLEAQTVAEMLIRRNSLPEV